MRARFLALATAGVALFASPACRTPDQGDPRMVSEWIHSLYGIVRAERLSPPVASRLFAYASVALHEGMASAIPGMPSLAGTLNGLEPMPTAEHPGPHHPTLVAVAAEQVLLEELLAEGLPGTLAALARLADSLDAAVDTDPDTRSRSRELGRTIGQHVAAWARTDGFGETRTMAYTPATTDPGAWINDSPVSNYGAQNLSGASQAVSAGDPSLELRAGQASDRALVMNRPKRRGRSELAPVNMAGATEPHWGLLRPFLLARWDECPIPAPPAYSTDTTSTLYREALAVIAYQRTLTPEQREIAYYWADNPGETATPAGHWIAIAGQLTSQRRLTAREAATLFLAGAITQADAFIATWGYKYAFNTIRPRTYIRRLIDPAWEPLIPTPPFPEYPAGHSTQSAAAAIALTAVLDDSPFEDSTGLAIGHPVRGFASFAQAAEEAGTSRLYGGIHFDQGNSAGRELGSCVGQAAVSRLRTAGVLR